MKKRLLITIDGPAGAGKSTVSRALAQRLGYRTIETGALYRVVAYEARSAGIRPDDDEGLEELCRFLKIELAATHRGVRVLSCGKDVTDHLRSPEIAMMASAISARPPVRKCLLGVQRELGRQKGVVFEGRDMGTVVFPDADIKFFLDAAPAIRAGRRHREMDGSIRPALEEIEKEMKHRDEQDRTRTLAPLKPAADAVVIDSTKLSEEQVVESMYRHVLQRARSADPAR